MGFISFLGKIYLMIVNIIFLIIGLACFAGGMIARFGDSITENWIKSAENELNNLVQVVSDDETKSIDIDMNELLQSASIFFISLGAFLLIVSILGFCGACLNKKQMLMVYVGICVFFLVVEIVVVILLYATNVVQDPIKDALKHSIEKEYTGIEGSDLASVSWNVLMIYGECCGVESFSDFTKASKWEKPKLDNGSVDTAVSMPLACCIELPSDNTDYSCAHDVNDALNYGNTGCFTKYWEWTLGNTGLVAGVLAGIGIFQLLLIISGILLIKDNSDKVSPSDTKVKRVNNRRNNWD